MTGFRPPRRTGIFILIVVFATALVVLLIRVLAGSWVTGAVVGGVSGGLAAAAYPALFRRPPA